MACSFPFFLALPHILSSVVSSASKSEMLISLKHEITKSTCQPSLETAGKCKVKLVKPLTTGYDSALTHSLAKTSFSDSMTSDIFLLRWVQLSVRIRMTSHPQHWYAINAHQQHIMTVNVASSALVYGENTEVL
jgi:hypothetical protein